MQPWLRPKASSRNDECMHDKLSMKENDHIICIVKGSNSSLAFCSQSFKKSTLNALKTYMTKCKHIQLNQELQTKIFMPIFIIDASHDLIGVNITQKEKHSQAHKTQTYNENNHITKR